ncbi:unnamed protein product [Phytophthora fragariaefolia]|uniref:Unnamed protein product n=1 Tax=Phytophthora fragariaefolia TaxID=1490495 RepID=A0A9W6YDJ5_9STRA|nr:unnamed protein product [Phytophthora fragariaefolia]
MNIRRVRPDLNDQLEVALDYTAYAIRASYHSVLRASPAQLLFGEDMITRRRSSNAPHPGARAEETDPVAKGPYVVKNVYDNGNVLLDTGSSEYRVNIRRISRVDLLQRHPAMRENDILLHPVGTTPVLTEA